MKYAMKYGPVDGRDGVPFKQFPQDADEVHIWYRPKDKTLLGFLQKTKEDRQTVCLSSYALNEKGSEFLGALCEKYGNIKLCVQEDFSYWDFDSIILLCAEYNIPFFFDFPVKNWETLKYLVDCGVTDVMIGGKLQFDLPEVHKFTKENGVNVRVIANYAWHTNPFCEPIKKPFIRPEDIDMYEPFIDILDFAVVNSNDQKVVVEAYRDKKRWAGDLTTLILGLGSNVPINNMCLDPAFGRFRLNCKHKCEDCLSSCEICTRMFELAKTLNEKNMYYPKTKKKIKENE